MSEAEPRPVGEREAWERFVSETREWCALRMRDDGELRIFWVSFDWSPDTGRSRSTFYQTDGSFSGPAAAELARKGVREHGHRGVVLCSEIWTSTKSRDERQRAGMADVEDDPARGEGLICIASHVAFGEVAQQAEVLRDPLVIKPWGSPAPFNGPMSKLATGWS